MQLVVARSRSLREILVSAALLICCDVCSSAYSGEVRTSAKQGQFRDCRDCPLMQIIAGGGFELTTPEATQFVDVKLAVPKNPVLITIPKPFAVGIYDVTRGEYRRFIESTKRLGGQGCEGLWDGQRWRKDPRATWRRPGFPQSEDDPVVCVSWDDAHAYVDWLNLRLAAARNSRSAATHPGRYRLLTGAEWEYVARGGPGDGPYPDNAKLTDFANLGLDQCWPCGGRKAGRDRWLYTSPVGSLAPNRLGLYDVFGNVWQWTDDCYQREPYLRQPKDGSQIAEGDCEIRMLRGVSWDDSSRGSSWRELILQRNERRTSVRNNADGFRVAKSLE